MASFDRAIAEVARTQLGLIERSQALAAGATGHAIRHRVEIGLWEPVHPRVYRVAGNPITFEQRARAACLSLGPGAVLSHRAALHLWDLAGPDLAVVEVSVPRARAPELPGVVIHRSADLAPHHCTLHCGMPVTNPLRTLVDLGAVCSPRLVERAVDSALARKLVGIDGLEAILAEVAKRGRSGAGVLRATLERQFGAGDSELEARLLRIIRDHGLPEPERQYEIRVGSRLVARVDFAYPDARVVIEADSRRHHISEADFQRDRTRQNELVRLGFTVLRYTWADAQSGAERVASEIAAVLGSKLAG